MLVPHGAEFKSNLDLKFWTGATKELKFIWTDRDHNKAESGLHRSDTTPKRGQGCL